MRLRLLRWLAVFAAVVCLAVFGFDIAARLSSVSNDVTLGVDVRKQMERESQPVRPLGEYDVVAGRNIFQEKRSGKTNENAEEKPPTALVDPGFGFEVVGTVLADKKDDNVAVIMNKRSKEQRLYRVGDMVGDAIVAEIRRNEVVIDNKGKRELLAVDYEKSTPARGRPASLHATPSMPQRITPRTTPSVQSVPAKATGIPVVPPAEMVPAQQDDDKSGDQENSKDLPPS